MHCRANLCADNKRRQQWLLHLPNTHNNYYYDHNDNYNDDIRILNYYNRTRHNHHDKHIELANVRLLYDPAIPEQFPGAEYCIGL